MAGGVGFGLRYLDNSRKAIKDARAAARKATEAAAIELTGKARRLVPVDNGTLRASLAHKVVGSGSSVAAFVGSKVHYAIYIHEGTGIFYEGDLPQRGGANPPWVYPDPRTGAMITTSGNRAYKFLETPLLENLGRYQKIIADSLRSGMVRWTRGPE